MSTLYILYYIDSVKKINMKLKKRYRLFYTFSNMKKLKINKMII